ncbi:MAG: hypothetical protein ACHQNA_03230 [Acidimicrobiales bacterium]
MVKQRQNVLGRAREGLPRHPAGSAGRLLGVAGAVSIVAAVSLGSTALASASGAAVGGAVSLASPTPFLAGLKTVTTVAPSAPTGGDVNPYGVAVVPASRDKLVAGDVLVSNFNNSANQQGTGTTIFEIAPNGDRHLFAEITPQSAAGKACGGVGLTTALAVFRRGWVVVGSLPTSDGTSATASGGCLFVIDSQGRVVRTITSPLINGPWDLAAADEGAQGVLFVANVLNGTLAADPPGSVVNDGTVVRIRLDLPTTGVPSVANQAVIASGFSERTDPNALVIGPTGAALGPNGTLYVADTLNNRISAVPDAMSRQTTAFTGQDLTSNGFLQGPLGLAIAPNGDILTVNSQDGNIVETSPSGAQVAHVTLDNNGGAGDLFGLAVAPNGRSLYFVDDFGGPNTPASNPLANSLALAQSA